MHNIETCTYNFSSSGLGHGLEPVLERLLLVVAVIDRCTNVIDRCTKSTLHKADTEPCWQKATDLSNSSAISFGLGPDTTPELVSVLVSNMMWHAVMQGDVQFSTTLGLILGKDMLVCACLHLCAFVYLDRC